MKKDCRQYVCWGATWLFLSVPSMLSVSVAVCQSRNPDVSQQTLSSKKMTDKVQIEAFYREMYAAMVAKDTASSHQHDLSLISKTV